MWKEYRPYSKSSLTLTLRLSMRVSSLFKNSNDTRGKLRLNLYSLSVSELLEYGRKSQRSAESRGFYPGTPVSSHRESWQGGLGKKGLQ
jgi:hypothetical protein